VFCLFITDNEYPASAGCAKNKSAPQDLRRYVNSSRVFHETAESIHLRCASEGLQRKPRFFHKLLCLQLIIGACNRDSRGAYTEDKKSDKPKDRQHFLFQESSFFFIFTPLSILNTYPPHEGGLFAHYFNGIRILFPCQPAPIDL
jgi:hypothetical protein